MLRVLLCSVIFLLAGSIGYGQGEYPQLFAHNIVQVKWSPQGDLYVTGHEDGTVRVYDETDMVLNIANAHNDAIYGLAFSENGQRLVTGGDDGAFRVWDTSTGEMIADISGLGGLIETASWDYVGNNIYLSDATNSVGYVIAADMVNDDYQIIQSLQMGLVTASAWKPDGSQLALGLPGTDVRIIDAFDYNILRDLDATPDVDILFPPNEATRNISWHPTQDFLANGNINGWIYVWNLRLSTDNLPLLSLKANDNASESAERPLRYSLEDVAFDETGLTLRSISADGTLRVWSIPEGELLHDIDLGDAILSAAFSPDGTRLVYNTYTTEDTPPVFVEIDELITEP